MLTRRSFPRARCSKFPDSLPYKTFTLPTEIRGEHIPSIPVLVMVDVNGGSEPAHSKPLIPITRSPRIPPFQIELPKSESSPSMSSEDDESNEEDDGVLEEEINNVLCISISKEQTRLISPTTSAPARTAARDDKRDWDFLDGANEDTLADSLRQSPPSSFDQSRLGFRAPSPVLESQEDLAIPRALPSPWTATPKVFETPSEDKMTGNIQKSRSRASTGPSSMLTDLNVRRFLSSLGIPTSTEQRPFKELSLPRLPAILGGTMDTSGNERIGSRSNRSSSFQIPRFPWSSSSTQTKSPSRDTFLDARPDSARIPQNNCAGPAMSPHAQPQLQLSTEIGSGDCATASQHSMMPKLCRASSDLSNPPQSALSKVSSLGDDSRWENVQGRVNSRTKAIIDSFLDSNIKLPNFPSLNLSALRPDFMLQRDSSDSKFRIHVTKGVAELENHCNPETGLPHGQMLDGKAHPGQTQRSLGSAHRYLDDALTCLTGDIVIMGGYRGSVLRSADPPYRQLWVPVKVGLNIRKVNLEVGLEPEDEENMEEKVFASGMLTHIGPIDLSRRLLKRLRSCQNAQEGKLRIHNYGYDWRLSPHLLSRKLIEYLEGLECNAACKSGAERGVTVIAHSLGGLITRHAVNQRPELFAGVVYAGVPQHCVNILGPLRNGDEVLLSSKVLTAQVNFTLRTSFVLLPESGECFIDKETKERYAVDFFNVQDWKDYAFSPCIAPALPALSIPERKSLFGTVSGSLPSVIGRKVYMPFTRSAPSNNTVPNDVSTVADGAANKTDDFAHPDNRGLNMQMGQCECTPSSAVSTIPIASAIAYLQRTLSATLAFKRELAFDHQHCSSNAYPPLAIIYSTSTPTVYGARVSGREGIRRTDAYDDLVFASGDGVVLARAAMLPKGYTIAEGGRVRTERGHVGLLGDLEAVGKCLGAVSRARRGGVGLGVSLDEVRSD